MGLLKEKYLRFRQWQRQPSQFRIASDEEQVCQCCGYRYVGNYCPRCSQKKDMGRINWHSIRRGLMDIWGLGTRSLPYSVWQLLCRPGYFIGEYISGKRQVSYPPVKMLCVMAVVYSFLVFWLFPEVFHIQLEASVDQEIIPFLGWNRQYFSWVGLFTAVLFILPTWLLFQDAPRYPKHSIPEGFFIQVLMTVLVIVINIISRIICGGNVMYSTCLSIASNIICYYVAYRQLFGYGWWGTLWRQLLMWISVVSFIHGLLILFKGINVSSFDKLPLLHSQTGMAIVMFALSAVALGIGYMLNRIAARRQTTDDSD